MTKTSISSTNSISARPFPPTPPVSNPSLLACANEISNYVATLEMHLSNINSTVFGLGGVSESGPTPSTLHGLLADASTRLAGLCGDLATVRSKVGGDADGR